MSLKIRLARGGAKKRPFYHIVVADSRCPRDGRFIEKIGFYNPMVAKDHADRVRLNKERAEYWLKVGAQPTERVALFLGQEKMIAMPAQPNRPTKALPKAKAQERVKEKADKAEAAKAAAEEARLAAIEAKKAEAAAAKAASEAPAVVEEAPAEVVVEAAVEAETPAAE